LGELGTKLELLFEPLKHGRVHLPGIGAEQILITGPLREVIGEFVIASEAGAICGVSAGAGAEKRERNQRDREGESCRASKHQNV
jgi:hypothetical protein